MPQEDCSRLHRFPSAFSRGLGPALASLSINMVTWTATLLLAPPFHTLTTRPFPAPSRAGTSLQGTQEDGVPGIWSLRTRIHCNKSVHLRWLTAHLPQLLYCPVRASRHSSLVRHTLHVSLSEDRGSTERKHGSPAGSGFFPRTVQAWRTMEQLSGFLHRGSFVPPFPASLAFISQRAEASRESPCKSPDRSLKHVGGWGDCLGLGERTHIQMHTAGCPPASLAPDTSRCQVPHTRGNPTQAPTRDSQRKWSLSWAPRTN